MLLLTPLERAVLEEIGKANRVQHPSLAAFLSEVVIVERRNTGHGFFTDLHAPQADVLSKWPSYFDGPNAHMIGMSEGAQMGFVLHCSAEEMTLEGFQYGLDPEGTVDLTTWNLADLQFSEVSWG